MITVLKGILEYAVYMHYINSNPYANIKINPKTFRQELKAKSCTQVFLVDEQPLIENSSLELFSQTNDVSYLSIPLNFQLGLRIGELVALEFSNINSNLLHVQKEEVKYKPLIDSESHFGKYII